MSLILKSFMLLFALLIRIFYKARINIAEFFFVEVPNLEGATRWLSWLRHCATSWKVAGLIPDGVIGGFHLLKTSGSAMALGSAQPLTEMSTSSVSLWGVGEGVSGA